MSMQSESVTVSLGSGQKSDIGEIQIQASLPPFTVDV